MLVVYGLGCYAYWFGFVLISCLGCVTAMLVTVDWLLANSVDYFVFCCFYCVRFVFDACGGLV